MTCEWLFLVFKSWLVNTKMTRYAPLHTTDSPTEIIIVKFRQFTLLDFYRMGFDRFDFSLPREDIGFQSSQTISQALNLLDKSVNLFLKSRTPLLCLCKFTRKFFFFSL